MDIATVVARCGVLIGRDARGFAHLATAWTIGGGDWVTAWEADEPPGADARLLCARDGVVAEIAGWEHDGGLAGFRSADLGDGLAPARDAEAALTKRAPLRAVGFPSVIDHPAFRLHHGSLDAQRYFPYLCSWTIDGHLALFTADDGWLAGRCFAGMAGGPVLDQRGEVVGLLLGGAGGAEDPPLARFRRVD